MSFSIPYRISSRLATIFAIALLIDCGKDVEENYFEEETTIQNAATGQNEPYDLLEIDYQAEVLLRQSGQVTAYPDISHCAVYTNNALTKTVTLDFGGPGVCTGSFPLARIRSGKVFINYSTTLADTVAVRTFTFENYLVNSMAIEGSFQLTPTDTTATGELQGICKTSNLKISFPNGTSMTYNGSQTRIWTHGSGDGIPDNNTYSISGDSTTGVTSSNRTYRTDITTPIFANFTCATNPPYYFTLVAGVIQLTKLEGYPDRTRMANYGLDSLCAQPLNIITYRRNYFLNVN